MQLKELPALCQAAQNKETMEDCLFFSPGLDFCLLQTEWLWLFMNEFKFVYLYSDLFRQRQRPVPRGLSLFCLYSLISLSGPSNSLPLLLLFVSFFLLWWLDSVAYRNISIPIREHRSAVFGCGSESVKRRQLWQSVLDKQISQLVILEKEPQCWVQLALCAFSVFN